MRWASTGSKQTGSATVASGRVQLRRIASATATRMVEAWLSLFCLQVGEEFFKILDGHPPRRAAAGHAGQVRRVQPQFAMRAFIRGDI